MSPSIHAPYQHTPPLAIITHPFYTNILTYPLNPNPVACVNKLYDTPTHEKHYNTSPQNTPCPYLTPLHTTHHTPSERVLPCNNCCNASINNPDADDKMKGGKADDDDEEDLGENDNDKHFMTRDDNTSSAATYNLPSHTLYSTSHTLLSTPLPPTRSHSYPPLLPPNTRPFSQYPFKEEDDEDYEEPSPEELEAMAREMFDELKNPKTEKVTVKKLKNWDGIKEVMDSGDLSKVDMVLGYIDER